MARLKKIGILDGVAFATGFALMAYELVASRLLAPTIGSSTYVWTSVIGVIIAALSLGYTVGGILADKRVQIVDIAYLLLVGACCMLATIFMADSILTLIADHIYDARLQGLTASLILFMPASFLMGMISPYLVRLRTVSVASTGRSVASLSALNAIGGIMGTFCAGFLFFGYIGARETVGVLSLLLIGVSWCIEPKKNLQMRFLVVALAALLAINAYAPKAKANGIDIDTPSAHYQVVDGTYKGEPVRVLSTGPYAAQSGIYLERDGLVFAYAKEVASIVRQAPKKASVLVLGGGTFTLPDYFSKQYPASHIDVVEIDPKLLDIAKEHFGYKPGNNIGHIFQDARSYLNQTTKSYDIIMVDVYGDSSIPFSVTTSEYVAQLSKHLSTGGIVIANVIASPDKTCSPIVGSIHATYRQTFSHGRVFATGDWNSPTKQNVVAVYTNKSLSWLTSDNPEIDTMPGGTILTDNYAPLERMEQQCAQH